MFQYDHTKHKREGKSKKVKGKNKNQEGRYGVLESYAA